MNISREIKFNGSKFVVYGKYTKEVNSEDGALGSPAEFDISEIHDVTNNKEIKIITDLLVDFYREIEIEVLILLQSENNDALENDEDDVDFEELMSVFGDTLSTSELAVQIPVKWNGFYDDIYDRIEINRLATRLAVEMSGPKDSIVACKINNEGIRFIRISDLDQIK